MDNYNSTYPQQYYEIGKAYKFKMHLNEFSAIEYAKEIKTEFVGILKKENPVKILGYESAEGERFVSLEEGKGKEKSKGIRLDTGAQSTGIKLDSEQTANGHTGAKNGITQDNNEYILSKTMTNAEAGEIRECVGVVVGKGHLRKSGWEVIKVLFKGEKDGAERYFYRVYTTSYENGKYRGPNKSLGEITSDKYIPDEEESGITSDKYIPDEGESGITVDTKGQKKNSSGITKEK